MIIVAYSHFLPTLQKLCWTGKHSPAKYKEEHATEKARAINKDWIMPMVTIRHPYSWMNSMRKNVSALQN